MRIGLLRHFPVEEGFPAGWRTAAELQRWREQYDVSPAIVGTADVGALPWDECLSTDLERAFATARAVFRGPIKKTALLVNRSLRLPLSVWRWVLRLSWLTGHRSQRACRNEFRTRVRAVADLLETKSGNILVVSHAGMMAYLSAELRRRGFAGPKLRVAKHATLYLYEKAQH